MNLGIFGGTFNPIHLGHLLLAEAAREALSLDRVLFVPARQPPHKPAGDVLPGAARLELIRLAISDHPRFRVSAIELRRPGVSYTIDTVRALRLRFPSARLFLLVGRDMLGFRWAGWEELKTLATLAVAQRVGGQGARHRTQEPGLAWIPMLPIGISSSEIRSRLRAGRSIRYLVPAAVERRIRSRKLYAARRS